jgi:prevent-host-death family protein
MDEIPVTQARAELSDLVNRVTYGGERIVLTRHGKAVAAIVSAADLARLGRGEDQAHEQPDDRRGRADVVVLGSDPGAHLAPAAEWDTEPPRA